MFSLIDKRLWWPVVAALAVQSAVALVVIPAFLDFAHDRGGLFGDVMSYRRYADRMLSGEVPYRDFRIEYPPLAVPLTVAPRLLAGSRLGYTFAFAFEMLCANALLVVLIARAVERREGRDAVPGRLWWYTSCFLVLCPLAVARYDLVPSLLATAAALAWAGGSRVGAGALAGVGALVKVFPGAVAGLGFLLEARDRRLRAFRGTVGFLATVVLGAALWFAVGGADGVRRSVSFQTERGLEVESLYSGALMLAVKNGLTTGMTTYDETSWHFRTPWSARLQAASVFIQLASLLLVFWRFHRDRAPDVARYSAAALVALVITSKILSPQFMLWILPAAALVGGRIGVLARRVFLPCCVATSVLFPWFFDRLLRGDQLIVTVLNLRNLLLVFLLFLLLFHRGFGQQAGGGVLDAAPIRL